MVQIESVALGHFFPVNGLFVFYFPSLQVDTRIHKETFEDCVWLDACKFKVTISRAQQLALSQGRGVVPDPAKQLEIMNQKKNKEPRAYHGLLFGVIYT